MVVLLLQGLALKCLSSFHIPFSLIKTSFRAVYVYLCLIKLKHENLWWAGLPLNYWAEFSASNSSLVNSSSMWIFFFKNPCQMNNQLELEFVKLDFGLELEFGKLEFQKLFTLLNNFKRMIFT